MNITDKIQERCKRAGISMNELCRQAAIPAETLVSWRKRTPQTIVSLELIMETYDLVDLVAAYNFVLTNKSKLREIEQATSIAYNTMSYWLNQGPPKTVDILNRIESVFENYRV